jgi:hypothetical protein
MAKLNQADLAGIGDVEQVEQTDMKFPRSPSRKRSAASLIEASPSRRRAAARTKTLSVNVNPELYAIWDDIREDKEQSVVRAVELSLIAFLEKNGKSFDL